MGGERLHAMVPFLAELENPFDADRAYDFRPDELIKFALTVGDYWADRALDWLSFGFPVGPVEGDLVRLVDDHSRPQALRHRAQRILKDRA